MRIHPLLNYLDSDFIQVRALVGTGVEHETKFPMDHIFYHILTSVFWVIEKAIDRVV